MGALRHLGPWFRHRSWGGGDWGAPFCLSVGEGDAPTTIYQGNVNYARETKERKYMPPFVVVLYLIILIKIKQNP